MEIKVISNYYKLRCPNRYTYNLSVTLVVNKVTTPITINQVFAGIDKFRFFGGKVKEPKTLYMPQHKSVGINLLVFFKPFA